MQPCMFVALALVLALRSSVLEDYTLDVTCVRNMEQKICYTNDMFEDVYCLCMCVYVNTMGLVGVDGRCVLS
jgi:hypothetical protein